MQSPARTRCVLPSSSIALSPPRPCGAVAGRPRGLYTPSHTRIRRAAVYSYYSPSRRCGRGVRGPYTTPYTTRAASGRTGNPGHGHRAAVSLSGISLCKLRRATFCWYEISNAPSSRSGYDLISEKGGSISHKALPAESGCCSSPQSITVVLW